MRLDMALVQRGLIATRARAQAAIKAGLVSVDGNICHLPAQKTTDETEILASEPWPWVSRAALKLEKALSIWPIEVAGKSCLDLGASTGGFCEILLHHGAKHVLGVEVGHGQTHERLMDVENLTILENMDARKLSAADIDFHLEGQKPNIITADLSFISITKVLPHILTLADDHADVMVLVKPQFEAGREKVGKGGLVAKNLSEPIARQIVGVLEEVSGFRAMGFAPSPITGTDGNLEFLLWLQR